MKILKGKKHEIGFHPIFQHSWSIHSFKLSGSGGACAFCRLAYPSLSLNEENIRKIWRQAVCFRGLRAFHLSGYRGSQMVEIMKDVAQGVAPTHRNFRQASGVGGLWVFRRFGQWTTSFQSNSNSRKWQKDTKDSASHPLVEKLDEHWGPPGTSSFRPLDDLRKHLQLSQIAEKRVRFGKKAFQQRITPLRCRTRRCISSSSIGGLWLFRLFGHWTTFKSISNSLKCRKKAKDSARTLFGSDSPGAWSRPPPTICYSSDMKKIRRRQIA